ncbi:MAG: MFS transporter [Chlamydiia bacterium]|nr:MFS transporter [Chlamydiia bacterium]
MNRDQKILGIFIYSLAALFLLYEMGLQVSPSVMTRQLMLSFNIGAGALGLMSSFYFYSYTVMQIPVGLLFDRFNARGLISSAVFVCSIGTFFFAFTGGVWWAAFGRLLMGFGSAFAFVGVLVVAARWFPPTYFAFLVGVAQFLAAIGALMGEFPLAALLDAFSWRIVMLILGCIGVILSLICFMIVRDNPFENRHLPKRHHLLAELKEIIASKQTWWIALYAFCGWGPVAVFAALWGVPYLRLRFQVPNLYAAMAMAFVWVGLGLTSPFLGWLSDRIGQRRILLTICSLIGLIASVTLFYAPGVSYALSFPLLFCIGIAAGGQILTFALVRDNNRHIVTGTAIGLNNMAVVAGGALFQPLVGFLLHAFWKGGRDAYGVPIYSIGDYHLGLLVVPLCFFIGLLVSLLFIKETYCKPRFEQVID